MAGYLSAAEAERQMMSSLLSWLKTEPRNDLILGQIHLAGNAPTASMPLMAGKIPVRCNGREGGRGQ